MAASEHHSDLVIYPLTLTPYSMATINRFFENTNKAQGMKYLIKDADHAHFPSSNEYALIQQVPHPST